MKNKYETLTNIYENENININLEIQSVNKNLNINSNIYEHLNLDKNKYIDDKIIDTFYNYLLKKMKQDYILHLQWSNKILFKQYKLTKNLDKQFFFYYNIYRLLNIFNTDLNIFFENNSLKNHYNLNYRKYTYDYGININLNNPLINCNDILNSQVYKLYVPPIYIFLNNRNLLIYYQLLLNPKIIKEKDICLTPSFNRKYIENKIKKMVSKGTKLKHYKHYTMDTNDQFLIYINNEEYYYDNECQYLCELIINIQNDIREIKNRKDNYIKFIEKMKIRNNHDFPPRNNFNMSFLSEDYQIQYSKFSLNYNKQFLIDFFKQIIYDNNLEDNNINITFKYLYFNKFLKQNSFELPEEQFKYNLKQYLNNYIINIETLMANILRELNLFYPVTPKNLIEFKNRFLYYDSDCHQINESFNYFISDNL